jgi:hypothetical protein
MKCGRELGVCIASRDTKLDETRKRDNLNHICHITREIFCERAQPEFCGEEMEGDAFYKLCDYVCNQEREKLENSDNLLRKLCIEKPDTKTM